MGAIALEIMVFILNVFLALRMTYMCHMVHLSGKFIQYVIGFLDPHCGESLTDKNFVGLAGV
jgi:hypothetical protein